MIQEAIYQLINGKDLTFEQAEQVMEEMMNGEATQAQMGGFLVALRQQGETIDEITAFAQVMREKGIKIEPKRDVIDIVGTGGDEAGTFNISTTSAFVVAAGGVPVAKHGNRSVSSKSGAADVLERLGANLSLTGEQNEKILAACDVCFLFAPVYHSSMKYAAPVRKELGVRTVFNILGPLSNPAAATMQLLGGYELAPVKCTEDWQVSLSDLLPALKDPGRYDVQTHLQEGISYADCLRIFLVPQSAGTLSMRALDIIEGELNCREGCERLHLDHCVDYLTAQVWIGEISLERSYGYEY